MDLASFRASRGLSLAKAAEELGLRSRGYLGDIENRRQACPAKLALKIERWSDGAIKAADLCPELKDLLPPTPAEARA